MATPESDRRARLVIERVLHRLPTREANGNPVLIINNYVQDHYYISRMTSESYQLQLDVSSEATRRPTVVLDHASITEFIAGLSSFTYVYLKVNANDDVLTIFPISSYGYSPWEPYSHYLRPTPANPLTNFIDRRTRTVPTYRITNYQDPTTLERVRNPKEALFIQENVRNGLIHGLYDPQSPYTWFQVQGQTTSPMTRRPVSKPFMRLPNYLARNTVNAGVQTNMATSQTNGTVGSVTAQPKPTVGGRVQLQFLAYRKARNEADLAAYRKARSDPDLADYWKARSGEK
jgi:hypothetical protein